MDIDSIKNLEFLNKELYNDLKYKADNKWGTKDTLPKLNWIFRNYRRMGGAAKEINPPKEPGYQKILKNPEVRVDFGPQAKAFLTKK